MKVANILKILGALSASYVIYKVGKLYIVRRKYKHLPGPPTKGIYGFFCGNISEVTKCYNEGKILTDYLLECNQKYGDTFKYQLMGKTYVFTSNTDAIKEIYVVKNYPFAYEDVTHLFNERFFGNGLATDSDMKRWKRRRAIFNHGFQRDILKTFVNQFNSKADALMEKLRAFADDKTVVSLSDEFKKVTLDAIAQIAFGLQVDSVSDKDPEFGNAIKVILDNFTKSVYDPFMTYKPSNQKHIRETRKQIRFIRQTGLQILNNRLNLIKNQDHIPNDILTAILKNYNEDMDTEIMVDDFLTFFLAGQETTASLISFCVIELGRHPEILEKAKEEIGKIIGSKSEISYQDAIDMKYCSCIVKEALRLYPPSHVILRRNPEEIFINNLRIPKNSTIVVSPYVSGRWEKYFKDPLEFKPERFVKDPNCLEKTIENYTFIPFSVGPRNCIGQNFAQIEAIICLVKLLQKFNFKLDPNQSFLIEEYGSITPKGGVNCTLSLRS